MTVNFTGTFRRTGDEEEQDEKQVMENLKAASWKQWPNEAGFDGLEEHRGPLELRVKGHIPSWAAGSLYRTGPGQSAVECTSRGTHYVSHWFDGLAHTHKFDIIQGGMPDDCAAVRYSSRRQSDELVADIKKKGWQASNSFAQRVDPCVGIFAKMMAVFKPAPANVSVLVQRNVPGGLSKLPKGGFGRGTATDNVFLFTDSSIFEEIHPETLEPIKYDRPEDLNPELNGPLGCAHSQRDPETGDLFNFNLALGRHPTYRVFRINAASGTTEVLATLTTPEVRPGYIHSLFLTENYVVLCIPSSHYAWNGLKIPWKGNLIEAIEQFDESKLMQWAVIDRRHGRGVVGRFTSPAGFFFHSINSFEEEVEDENGEIKVDLNFDMIAYESTEIMHSFYYDVLLDRHEAARKHWIDDYGYKTCRQNLIRYRFTLAQKPPPVASQLTSADLVFSIPAPHCGELPTTNPTRATQAYRYVYSAASRGLSTFIDCLVKTDLETRDALVWAAPAGHTPGEAIFVVRPGADAEDDGVLLSVVLDGTAQRSYLLVLDARTMEEMGRAETEFAVALGIHGIHAPEVR